MPLPAEGFSTWLATPPSAITMTNHIPNSSLQGGSVAERATQISVRSSTVGEVEYG
jgi:hypothetical protein